MFWPHFSRGLVRSGMFSVFAILVGLTAVSLSRQINQTPSAPRPQILAATTQQFQDELQKEVTVLLLGLDGRRGDARSRCDAIHLISFKPREKKIIITSIPRGTIVDTPGADPDSSYLSNVCHSMGIDFAIKKIAAVAGLAPDYVVKVGFSQAQGLFRLGNLPAEPTLEFLRSRQFGIGDYQRSYNQAVFIKDLIATRTNWAAALPEPIQSLAYKILDTDLPFAQAKKIFREILASGVYKDPANIDIVIKPEDGLARQEIHLPDKISQTGWQSDPGFRDYQENLIDYLEKITAQKNLAAARLAVSQQLWLQIENANQRDQWQTKLEELLTGITH